MERKCPKCRVEMDRVSHPDIELDVCPDCKGIFFDKGELQQMITARNMPVESVPDIIRPTQYRCPACQSKMNLVELSFVSGVEIERCPDCKGLFLDSMELETINVKLREENGQHEEKYRKFHDKNLVTVQSVDEVYVANSSGQYGGANLGKRIVVKVYYEKKLGIDLSVLPRNHIDKVMKIVGLDRGVKLTQVQERFTKDYVVRANSKLAAERALPVSVQNKLLEINAGKIKVYNKKGKIKVFDNGIVYREGLYRESEIIIIGRDTEKIRSAMLEMARVIER